VIINEKVKKELKQGDAFGELALLYSAPRSASIKAKENVSMWAIDRRTFRKAVEEMVSKEYEENRKFIENIKFFRKKKSIFKKNEIHII
jgi:cGMP-dependent protein kinase